MCIFEVGNLLLEIWDVKDNGEGSRAISNSCSLCKSSRASASPPEAHQEAAKFDEELEAAVEWSGGSRRPPSKRYVNRRKAGNKTEGFSSDLLEHISQTTSR